MNADTIPAALATALPVGVQLDDCDLTTYDDSPVVILPGWHAGDGTWAVYYPTADSADEAAQLYVDEGDWGDDRHETCWIHVHTWRVALTIDEDEDVVREEVDHGRHTVTLEAEEPDCVEGEDHDWGSPYSVVGGLRENPGVYGHGGGVIMTDVCLHCGRYRVTDTWAQDRETGEQGLRSTEYREADSASLAYVWRRMADRAERIAVPDGYSILRRDDVHSLRLIRDDDHEYVECSDEDLINVFDAGTWDHVVAGLPNAAE